MLINEIDWIYEILSKQSSKIVTAEETKFEIDKLDLKFNKIRATWDMVVFSRVASCSLKRYFQLHLEGILDILDTFSYFEDSDNKESQIVVLKYIRSNLESLLMYLKKNFYIYLNLNIKAPQYIKRTFLNSLQFDIYSLKDFLFTAAIDVDLKTCLSVWLEQVKKESATKEYTFAMLDYIIDILTEIKKDLQLEEIDATATLSENLMFANFNYLGFFQYRQLQIQKGTTNIDDKTKLKILKDERLLLKFSEESTVVYDNRWPSLKTMLLIWVGEEIESTQQSIKENEKKYKLLHRHKLYYNISVAHLALLTKLFQKENFFGDVSLTEIFKFMSIHYRTKRQDNISLGSISKSFYSTDQVTAAVVKDKLQNMINRINRDFFPVLIVAMLFVHA